MKTLHRLIKRPMYAASLALGAALVPLLAAQGQPTVEPATQPTDTLAPYVLERTSLEPRPGTQEEGGTLAYRPWFENGAWTGDLIQYEITEDGLRVPRDDIGRYPRDGQDWRGTSPLWSARYAFPDFEWYDEAQEFDPSWQCVEETELGGTNVSNYWQNRNIFTVFPGGNKIDFLWNSLSAEQQQAVDSATYDLQFTNGNEALQTNPYASPILSFLRGDRSNERCKQDGVYRWRFSVLGAIINSRPVYVPTTYIPLSGGTETVDGLVVVGANDGMLHGFSAADGTEQFAYIPSMLLDKLGALRISPYRPTYFVDGELRNANIGTSASPRHMVTGGLGAGGKGLFVLDVSDPVSPTVSLELAGDNGDHVDPAIVDSRIGYVYGRPTIARIPDGTVDGAWHVVTGNGYGSNSDVAQLVLIPLNPDDGSAGTPRFIPTDGSDNNGLSAPSLVDSDSDGTADVAYAGDLRGNLWRFDLETDTATKLFAAGANKPITVQPDVAVHPEAAQGFIVYFGTGSLLSGADAQSTDPQTMYGIWDRGDGLTVATSRLVTQELKTRSQTWDVPQDQNLCGDTGLTTSDSTVRYIGNPQSPVWTGTNPNLGWQVALPRAGERLIGHPQIRAERVQFITTNPYDMADTTRMNDADSGSWILQLDLASGANAASPRALFDLNKNCQLDLADGSPEGFTVDGASISEGTFPVGVNLGPFNISQPAFARVLFNPDLKSVVDGVYINGLQLPGTEPPEALANGPLDVTTDSPSNSGVTEYRLDDDGELLVEPTKSPFALRPFPEASGPTKPFLRADGLGKRVDGHSFGYLQHHGVDHVDFFDLEPRRGLSRLDVGATYIDENGDYRPIVFDTDPDTGEQIQRVSKQELSRVTEVVEDDQKFIVVVANADLSRENEITIGCTTRPIYEYQTIVMEELRNIDLQNPDPLDASLVFTLDGIRSESGCTEPTLRITPTARIGAQDATMGTLPGCVNNTDLYEGPSRQEFLETRKDMLAEDGELLDVFSEADLYGIDPHATPPPPVNNNQPQTTGYRWRNGALTVQLLAVNDDLTPAFEIQERDFLPEGPGIEGEDFGWGGAYAKAFDIRTEGSGNNAVDVVVPVEGDDNGLLYELSMFWHWGDMARFQSSGKGSPVVPICYGTTDYVPSIARETEWFTPGAYSQLTADFTGSEENEALQDEYASLIAQLQSGQENLDSAVQRLQEILTLHPDIADYHRLRHYVPNSKQLNENHLIRIDKSGQNIELAVDGTPVDVVDIERDLLPSLGPNYQLGRRSWIDLVPEE